MIPKIIHFIYGLESDFGGKEFSFVHWAAIKSAMKANPGYRFLYWHKRLPDNFYFSDVRDSLELMPIEPPDNIFGNPLCHVAHKTDVTRLVVLCDMGGIYLDMDTITVRSFDSLLPNKCVMGYEEAREVGVAHGLCNAVIMAERGSQFLLKWFDCFKTFRSKGRDEFWAEHAVQVPMRVAQEMPTEITTLPKEAFFYPGWTEDGLQDMFYRSKRFPGAFVHHLWESLSWGALKSINELNCTLLNCSYTTILNETLRGEIAALAAKRRKWIDVELQSGNAKLNLGCGPNRDIASVNCDLYPQTGADLVFDVTAANWPLPSNSVRSVLLSHVLEHLPNNLENFFRELYRVTRNGAEIVIKVPHPRHDWFLIDPTHVKGWHEESFAYLDKAVCMKWYFSGDSKTPLALYWNIDFKVEAITLFKESQEVDRSIAAAFGAAVSEAHARKFLNNYISEVHAKLRTRKSVCEEP